MNYPKPYFMLDNGIDANMASPLSRLGYDIESVQRAFGVNANVSIDDDDIFAKIKQKSDHGVWITRDGRARTVWRDLIRSQGISVAWLDASKPTNPLIRTLVHVFLYYYQHNTQPSSAPEYFRLKEATLKNGLSVRIEPFQL